MAINIDELRNLAPLNVKAEQDTGEEAQEQEAQDQEEEENEQEPDGKSSTEDDIDAEESDVSSLKDDKQSESKSDERPSLDSYESWAKDNGYISPEDYEDKLQDELSKSKLSPTLQKYKELEDAGYDITDPNFMQKVNRDYSKYDTDNLNDAMEVLILREKERNPNQTDAKIRRKIELRYEELFSDEYSKEDREYERAMIKMSDDANIALDYLKDNSIKIESTNKTPNQTPEQKEAAERLVKRGRGQYERVIKNNLKSNDTIKINFGKDKTLEYRLSDGEQAGLLSNFMGIYDSNPSNWLNEEGLNRGLISEDEFRNTLNFFVGDMKIIGSIIDKAVENAANEKEVEIIKQKKNAAPPESKTKETVASKKQKTDYEKIAESGFKFRLPS